MPVNAKRFLGLLLLSICLVFGVLFSQKEKNQENRPSSAPFVSGDTFRAFSDHIFDETSYEFDPDKVRSGQTVFVKTDFLGFFLEKYFPKISQPFVLITHNSDAPIPGSYAGVLKEKNIIAWFGQNVEGMVHHKLHPIPIGVANQRWPHGNIKTFKSLRQRAGYGVKKVLAYLNFELKTHPIRSVVHQYFKKLKFCKAEAKRKFEDYLLDMSQSQFVISPRGNGLDCHRTWESLLMGSYPIIQSSASDCLFNGLPVVIVSDWDEVTEEFLQKKYIELSSQSHEMEKIYFPYWENLIKSYQEKYL